MSRTAVNDVLDRALLDPGFRHALLSDPDVALEEYELTAEERRALVSNDFKEMEHVGAAHHITARFVITTDPPLIAVRPVVDRERREHELNATGAEIAAAGGDQTEAIKRFLVRMR
jgi:hypothetical protein